MTSTEIAAASKIMLGTTEAVAMYIGSTKIWPTGSAPQPHDYSQDYFTIESLVNNNTIKIGKSKSPSNLSLSYSTNGGETWTDLTISASRDLTTINAGDKLIIKGVNNCFSNAWDSYYKFNSTGNFKVYGNAMSLLFGDNFINNSEFLSGTANNLCGIFYGTTTLIDASDLILPALTCFNSCYNGMFRGCTNLQHGPKILPATRPANACYSSMFEGCINLEEAPEIRLTSMGDQSCQRMFCMNRNSKLTTPKLTKGPILRCTSGYSNCYKEMFKGNGNLVEVTCLLNDTINSTADWLTNCSSTGVLYKNPLKTWLTGTSACPSGWTQVDYVES